MYYVLLLAGIVNSHVRHTWLLPSSNGHSVLH